MRAREAGDGAFVNVRTVVGFMLGLAAALICIGGMVGFPGLIEGFLAESESPRSNFVKNDSGRHIQIGESISMDGPVADGYDSSNQELYFDTRSKGVVWTGSLRMTVEDVSLFDSPADAGVEEPIESKGGEWGSDLKFAMVTLRVANDNAVPMDVSRSGKPWFLVTDFVRLGLTSPVWFDGTPAEAIPPEYYYFDLPPGAEKTLRVGFEIMADDIPSQAEIGVDGHWKLDLPER